MAWEKGKAWSKPMVRTHPREYILNDRKIEVMSMWPTMLL